MSTPSGRSTSYPLEHLAEMTEDQRLDINHALYKAGTNGKLILAPIDFDHRDLRVLDSGTHHGHWLEDVWLKHLHGRDDVTLVGTDINRSLFPKCRFRNTRLYEQDINESWPVEWHASFDLVHQRLVLGATSSPYGYYPRVAVQRLLQVVKPGGWVQLEELSYGLEEGEYGPALRQLCMLERALLDYARVGWKYPRDMADWVREEGFMNVERRNVPIYLGKKAAEPEMRVKSAETDFKAANDMIEPAKRFLYTPTPWWMSCCMSGGRHGRWKGGMSLKELETLPQRLYDELLELVEL